jgi:hypothetical protein
LWESSRRLFRNITIANLVTEALKIITWTLIVAKTSVGGEEYEEKGEVVWSKTATLKQNQQQYQR